jgi:transposase
MDESPRQLIKETRSIIPIRPGMEKRIDYEYERFGVCNVFLASEPLVGKRIIEIRLRKTRRDWAEFLKKVADEIYPNVKKITLVMDNLKTHTTGALYERYSPEEAKRLCDKFEFVYTPKHGSWLNMAEIELRVLSGQCLNRRLGTIEEMTKEVKAWETKRNNKNSKISWQFTTKDARTKLKKLYPSYYE